MKKQFAMACVATSLVVTPASRAAADAGDAIAGGIIGGLIGGAIMNESKKKRKVYRKTYRPSSGISSATRQQNKEVQTSLNYFGFPAGTVDGVLGRNSRNAISQYQAHMGYPATGRLTPYERDFLVTSYHRAIAGGPTTSQMIAANPQGPRGLLKTYQQQLATGGVLAAQPVAPAQPGTTVVINPQPQAAPQAPVTAAAPAPAAPGSGAPAALPTLPTVTATAGGAAAGAAAGAATPALPTFLGQGGGQSLNSHCNKVNLVTNSNGGFTTAASMTDASFALEEQFCLARTYAIAAGEDIAAKITGVSSDQIAEQCSAFGPALKEHVASLSFDPMDQVVEGVRGFVLASGMSPGQLSGTAKVCLSVGYRTDNMDVAIGSGLLLVAMGETVYGELMGHHLAQGFGTAKRTDLALDWYEASLEAVEGGTQPVFAPGQPERSELLRKAAYQVGGRADGAALSEPAAAPQPAALPTFSVDN